MSRARDLSRLSSPSVFSVDATDASNNKVGVGSENPTAKLNVAGIVSATAFYGDGSNLEGVGGGAGLGTALGASGGLEVIYYTDNVLSIGATITVDPPSSTNIAYTQYAEVSLDQDADLIIADGDDFIPDVLGLSTAGVTPLTGAGGRIRADFFTNKAGTGAPTFQTGVNVSGAATIGGNLNVGGVLTYEDVTNIDSIGIITARSNVSIADSIIHTGDTDTSIRFPAAGTFTVSTNGSEAVRVDSSGRLLVGTDTAVAVSGSHQFKFNVSGESFADSGTLQVRYGTGSGPAAAFANARGTTSSPQILQDDDELGKIRFYGYDGTDFANYGALIQASVDGTPGSNDMPGRLIFSTTADGAASPTERLRITSAGNVEVKTGNLVMGTSGKGIDFSATGDAGGMTSELLDDYEEGTWTPGVGGSATYTGTPSGTYTKVGRFVYVTCDMTINVIGTGSATVISTLPFASIGGLENSSAVGYWSALSRNVTSLMACTNSSQVVFTDTTSATSGSDLNSGVFQNGTNIRFSLSYQTNA